MGLATIDQHSQKERTGIHKSPSLVLIRPRLTEIQRFKNVNHPDASEWPYISLQILTFSNGCVFLSIKSIYTKLEGFVKLGMHFMTLLIP